MEKFLGDFELKRLDLDRPSRLSGGDSEVYICCTKVTETPELMLKIKWHISCVSVYTATVHCRYWQLWCILHIVCRRLHQMSVNCLLTIDAVYVSVTSWCAVCCVAEDNGRGTAGQTTSSSPCKFLPVLCDVHTCVAWCSYCWMLVCFVCPCGLLYTVSVPQNTTILGILYDLRRY